ncbi:MAG TPA: tRNA (adenosine(37)-N6)-dimethylallyltransferase MiaA [Bacteroidales bacterium]|nr:tRNA (adenosine(37)-N6)-dimethylallyltransferase MiaA [Bacteroidales bacterium]
MGRYNNDMVVVTGATASGKTGFAARLAAVLGGEIISADSRQVYRGMNIGTGKDYDDYIVDGVQIPYHLVDIADAGYKYNVYEYQRDFLSVYNDLKLRKVLPVVCGGSGMYLDSIISGYKLIKVPVNEELRKSLADKSPAELSGILSSYKDLHNITDIDTPKRAIRAIEIEEYYIREGSDPDEFPEISPLVLGIRYDRDKRRERISQRLESRLDSGLVEEVKALIDRGISTDDLIYYGLEYKFITMYLLGQMTYNEMKKKLETAIHQFAKRQMTWFRGMERRGIKIHWIDGELSNKDKLARALMLIKD